MRDFALKARRTVIFYNLDDIFETEINDGQEEGLIAVCAPPPEAMTAPSSTESEIKLPEMDRVLIHEYILTFGFNKISTLDGLHEQLDSFAESRKTKLLTKDTERLLMYVQLYLSHLKELIPVNE